MKNNYILYDLDGTLTDPRVGITKSIEYALAHFGIDVENLNELTKFIGPPLRDTFREYYSFSDSDVKVAVDKFQEYFAEQGLYENIIYDGIAEMLRAQYEDGRKIVLATSKPQVFAHKVLEQFKIDKYFELIVGSELSGERSDKAEVIKYAVDTLVINPSDAIMIGDRKYDVIGSRAHGIDSIGVLYGYSSKGELREAGANYIVETVEELGEKIIDLGAK